MGALFELAMVLLVYHAKKAQNKHSPTLTQMQERADGVI